LANYNTKLAITQLQPRYLHPVGDFGGWSTKKWQPNIA